MDRRACTRVQAALVAGAVLLFLPGGLLGSCWTMVEQFAIADRAPLIVLGEIISIDEATAQTKEHGTLRYLDGVRIRVEKVYKNALSDIAVVEKCEFTAYMHSSNMAVPGTEKKVSASSIAFRLTFGTTQAREGSGSSFSPRTEDFISTAIPNNSSGWGKRTQFPRWRLGPSVRNSPRRSGPSKASPDLSRRSRSTYRFTLPARPRSSVQLRLPSAPDMRMDTLLRENVSERRWRSRRYTHDRMAGEVVNHGQRLPVFLVQPKDTDLRVDGTDLRRR